MKKLSQKENNLIIYGVTVGGASVFLMFGIINGLSNLLVSGKIASLSIETTILGVGLIIISISRWKKLEKMQ